MNIIKSVFSAGGIDSAIPLVSFCINLALAFILSCLAGVLYVRYGHSLSNRRRFARSFILLGIITTIIISIVSSSLALSLGLVGALSIVRFRTPIKEPEELVYLFLVIALGLGLGSNRPVFTIVGFAFAALVIRLQAFRKNDSDAICQVLSLISPTLPAEKIYKLTDILKLHCTQATLKRFDEYNGNIEAIFVVDIKNFRGFIKCKEDLQTQYPDMQVSFFDSGLLVEE
ncbi:MAG: DUF4956 domain-containing protein [bacterium]